MYALIEILHKAHIDNAKRQYVARRERKPSVQMMPFTSFVFEYFIFNSIYQIDWEKTIKSGIIYHLTDDRETTKQRKLLKFLKQRSKKQPHIFTKSFKHLSLLPTIEGEWTNVTPDALISSDFGHSFFKRIRKLQNYVSNANKPDNDDIKITKAVFDPIDFCTYYIYYVRNNIFHGSKNLGEIHEQEQKMRIGVYDLFLKGLNSLFFLAVENTCEKNVASDCIQLPVCNWVIPNQYYEILEINMVWSAVIRKFMKSHDSRLIALFCSKQVITHEEPIDKSALFYPSAGTDLLTPIILGLPYCREFYFYEKDETKVKNYRKSILNMIKGINGLTIEQEDWQEENGTYSISFNFNGIKRNIYWICSDNKNFLCKDVNLTFYFHRGDSLGEGGSGQKWDSFLLPELINKVPKRLQCKFITDGEPGGLSHKICQKSEKIIVSITDNNYYTGIL